MEEDLSKFQRFQEENRIRGLIQEAIIPLISDMSKQRKALKICQDQQFSMSKKQEDNAGEIEKLKNRM